MGQYQQWLLAQEIERRLKAEVETLETELLYLRDRITILEQTAPESENVILQALQTYLHAHTREELAAVREKSPVDTRHGLNIPRTRNTGNVAYASGFYATMNQDMLAFFDRHGQTHPTPSPRPIQEQGGNEEEEHLFDEETRRLNEDIRRWFARWHRELRDVEQTEGMQYE